MLYTQLRLTLLRLVRLWLSRQLTLLRLSLRRWLLIFLWFSLLHLWLPVGPCLSQVCWMPTVLSLTLGKSLANWTKLFTEVTLIWLVITRIWLDRESCHDWSQEDFNWKRSVTSISVKIVHVWQVKMQWSLYDLTQSPDGNLSQKVCDWSQKGNGLCATYVKKAIV